MAQEGQIRDGKESPNVRISIPNGVRIGYLHTPEGIIKIVLNCKRCLKEEKKANSVDINFQSDSLINKIPEEVPVAVPKSEQKHSIAGSGKPEPAKRTEMVVVKEKEVSPGNSSSAKQSPGKSKLPQAHAAPAQNVGEKAKNMNKDTVKKQGDAVAGPSSGIRPDKELHFSATDYQVLNFFRSSKTHYQKPESLIQTYRTATGATRKEYKAIIRQYIAYDNSDSSDNESQSQPPSKQDLA